MDAEQRSYVMSQIKSKDTKPEMLVRRYLHAAGLRYTLHSKKLPGKPDLVFPKYQTALFVHGCFWHGHQGNCRIAHMPKSRQEYWMPKIQGNIDRAKRHEKELRRLGYKVIVLWECDIQSRFESLMIKLIEKIKVPPREG